MVQHKLLFIFGAFIFSFFYACTTNSESEKKETHTSQLSGEQVQSTQLLTKPEVTVTPGDAQFLINEQRLEGKNLLQKKYLGQLVKILRKGFKPKEFILENEHLEKGLEVTLEPELFDVTITCFPNNAHVSIAGKIQAEAPVDIPELPAGMYTLEIKNEGYVTRTEELFIDESKTYQFKLSTPGSRFKHIKTVACGLQPKQVTFSPDGSYIVVALLDEEGFQLFDTKTMELTEYVVIPEGHAGYVQAVFRDHTDEIWISQLSAGKVFVYDTKDFSAYKKRIRTHAMFSKVIAFNYPKEIAFIVNWLSHNVSVIDMNTYELIKHIPIGKWPRGAVFTLDGSTGYVAGFGSGTLYQVNCDDYTVSRQWYVGGALRDIRITNDGNWLYISNLGRASLHEFSLENLEFTRKATVFEKPNTIRLSPDEKWIYVSCRGPNSPKGYMHRSLIDGKVYIIDRETFEPVDILPGGRQPTGLDISPDGKLVCFSNFQDHNLEFWQVVEPQ